MLPCGHLTKGIVPLERLHAHHNPLYSDCRAYRKLKETNLDGKAAVRFHSYTILPARIEPELEEGIDIVGSDPDDDDKPTKKRAVLRAIMKDLVMDDFPLAHRVAKKMRKDLLVIREKAYIQWIQKQGII